MIRSAIVIAAAVLAAAAGGTRSRLDHASLEGRPTHNALYQVAAQPGRASEWTFRVRNAAGQSVDDATVLVQAWMPLANGALDNTLHAEPRANGGYRVANLPLAGSGWWNIKLVVRSRLGTESAAFNVTLR